MSDKTKIVDFSAAAKKRGKPIAKPAPVVTVTGNNNAAVAGDHNNIQINVKAPARRRVQVNVQPGAGAITQAQAAEIQELVKKVVDVSGKPFPTVWGVLKKKYRYTSYLLLPAVQFEDVRAYLRKWIASAGRAVPSSPDADRKRALARINAEAKKTPGRKDDVRAYILDRYDAGSLADLSIVQLLEVIKRFGF
jgi:hypothetical protein